MAKYRISGIWKENDIVIAYSFHQVYEGSISMAEKKTKEQAIALLEDHDNTATTWIWNYATCRWIVGESVRVMQDENGKYLSSNRNNKLTYNLGHLLNLQLIACSLD
ncbi:MAG: DUF3892 domain-containing protein [Bacteroidota bacterium]